MKTKTILFLTCFLVFYVCELKAQKLKLKAGISFPSTSLYWQEFDEYDDFVLNLGFLVGPTYEFSINEANKLEIGALLNLKGYNSIQSKKVGEFEGHHVNFNLLYIDFPILYGRQFKLGDLNFIAEIGPYTGIGIKGKHKAEYYYLGELKYEETILFGKNSIDYLKKVDFGLLAGLGIKLERWEFGMSFSLGLIDISKSDYDEIKNRVFAIYTSVPIFSKEKNKP